MLIKNCPENLLMFNLLLERIHFVLLSTLFCISVIGLFIIAKGWMDAELLRQWLLTFGVLTPVAYVALYILATFLFFSTTPLSYMGGELFGLWRGTLLTMVAVLLAAIATFVFTRIIGREQISQDLTRRCQAVDAEIHQHGMIYLYIAKVLTFWVVM